jgi:hypothetical protein
MVHFIFSLRFSSPALGPNQFLTLGLPAPFTGEKATGLLSLIFIFSFCWLCEPLWSSGQSSWLQIRRPGFDSRHYQKKKSSGSGTGSTQPREYN